MSDNNTIRFNPTPPRSTRALLGEGNVPSNVVPSNVVPSPRKPTFMQTATHVAPAGTSSSVNAIAASVEPSMRLFSKTTPLTNGLEFKKWCCDKPTHFPKKMIGCEDLLHDIAARLGQASALDAIITVGPLTVSNETIFDPIYDHAAIQCNVNGLTLFSLNLEGCCRKNYNKTLHHDRWKQLKDMVKSLHPFPDIFCFQELFLKSNMPDPKDRRLSALALMQELLDTKQSNFIYIYDDFTGGTIVNKECIRSDQSVYYPDIHLTNPVKFIARYKDLNKKYTMVHVYKGDTSFYVVNVHLKAIQTSITGNSIHKKEVANLLAHLKEEMKVGIVFIGDHNTTQPLRLYTQAGGRRTTSRNGVSSITTSTKNPRKTRKHRRHG